MLDILVVDDDDIVRQSITGALERAGHRVSEARDGLEALTLADSHRFDVAICDVQMPRLDGLTLLRRLRLEAPGTAVILVTSFGRIPDAVGSLRDGATDYVTKPFDPDEFARTVINPIAERRKLRQRFEDVRAQYLDRATGTHVVAESAPMRALLDRIATMAQSDASVLITGERGTGKKLLARRLHEQGPRHEGPFVIVPCAILPSLLFDSDRLELQGLGSRRHGWFHGAEGGTLVLDGVDELPIGAQGALVRVLESEPSARRGPDWRPLGVRLVSLASGEIADRLPSQLLPTLFFRLNNVTLRVPPLRERPSDLLPLTERALEELTPPGRSMPTIEPAAWAALRRHTFPGNLDELTQALAHAVSLAGAGTIELQHLPPAISRAT
jgi:DNA-binding NtrC family response regulator